ncbi:Vps51/Vps67 protein [Ceratobasidium sp. AG-Ba]|nr:Vps51/Vps67 protein [Ceratobasidium sp. AG-Ba]
MFLSSKSRALNLPIPATTLNASLVKSPGSYTSPETPVKSLLLGNGVTPTKESLTDADYSRIDPDDMFVRYSVSEIRAIRARLLADADGKREELRQMVGERYRDLLHASTAITNMAGISERAVDTLADMRESCAGILQLDEGPRARHRSVPNGKGTKAQEDAHLKTLQILSAHLKLLLDSPEHLWRWLEKKQFLHAAWLFLLARTVHRKLSKSADDDDSEDEESEGGDINWPRHGIDIVEQFPIAARQWEAIGQFRPQIVHKATQALREPGASHKEVAETLIAILLLDALSTARTRSLFLSQRGKTLAVLLNPPLSTSRRAISPNRAQNRKATAALLSPASPAHSLPSPSILLLKTPISAPVEAAKAERKAVKEVVKSFRAIFSLIGGTLATVRAIYGTEGLLARIISDIQSDAPISAALPPTASQPNFPLSGNTQLLVSSSKSLTTPQILQSLPSASLLLRFLPSSIVGYTPYISTESEESGIDSDQTERELRAWMTMALEALAAPAKSWLGRLESVRAIWAVRASVISGIASLEGTTQVKENLERAVEAAFAVRVVEVWERRLENVETATGSAINKAIALLANASGEEDTVKTGLQALSSFTMELPHVQADASSDSSYQYFERALNRRANRRTPLLDSVLSEMEETARELREELKVISGEETNNEVAARLASTYQPRAGETCMRVTNAISKALEDASTNDSVGKTNTILFVGRLANSLADSSSFIGDLSCSQDIAQGKYMIDKKVAATYNHQ